MKSGHFFCSFCNDVVFIRFRGEPVETCPVCRNNSAQFVEHVKNRRGRVCVDLERGKQLFAQMRQELHRQVEVWSVIKNRN